jgi:putative hemolysin
MSALAYDSLPSRLPAPFLEGHYRVRFAEDAEDLDAVLRLRYEVFNVELQEGLAESHATGRDEDRFDAVCDHLIVEDLSTCRVVGTYRIQTAEMAAAAHGFYSADEFDLRPLAAILPRAVELGRACIAREHRNRRVLFLLWRGLAEYLVATGKTMLFGCCSLTSQDPAEGARVWAHLEENGHVDPALRPPVQPAFASPRVHAGAGEVAIPTLFSTYLRFGATVLGGPAIDRAFRTIDYLVLLDVTRFDDRTWSMFFGNRPRMQ